MSEEQSNSSSLHLKYDVIWFRLRLQLQLRGLYPAPQIPAGIRWNDRIPAELYLAEGPAKFAIPGTTNSGGIEPFRN